MEEHIHGLGRVLARCGLAAALALPLLLCACGGGDGGAQSTPPPAHSLGLMQLTVNGLGSGKVTAHAEPFQNGPRAAVAGLTSNQSNGLDVEQVSAGTVDIGTRGIDGTRYISVVLRARNAQNCATPGTCTAYPTASHNLTFVAANSTGNLSNTAVTAIYREDGTTDSTEQALALQMLPTDGMHASNPAGGVVLAEGQSSLQVFNESEITGAFVDPTATYLFPYGYVVENVNTSGSRSLPASPADNQWDGQLTFAFKVPLQAHAKDDPYSVSFIFDVLDDTNTRVTESAETQNIDGDQFFNLLAASLGGTDLAVLGGHIAATNIGDPICTVRTAGAAGAATAYLTNNGGPSSASAPSNLLLSPSAILNFGFCTPMDVATATPATAVLSGSESGLHAGSFSAGGNLLSFTPATAFTPGETVSYTFTTGVQAIGGTPLAQPLVGSYTVGGLTPSGGSFAVHGTPLSLPVGVSPAMVLAADFNGDGKLDFVISDTNHANLIVYLGNGDGSFAAGISHATPFAAATLAIGDFNGDGKLDIIAGSTLLPGNGDGSFGTGLPITLHGQNWLAAGDFNGDGKLDLLSTESNFVYFSPGNGDGTFGTAVAGTPLGGDVSAFATGDFNGDGKLDVAVADSNGNLIWIYLGNGDGSFSPTAVTYPTGQVPFNIITADFNGDGKLDLATINFVDGSTSVVLGKGDGSFGATTTYQGGAPFSGGIAAADVNGDGRQDLVVPDYNGPGVSILLGRADGGFDGPTLYAAGGIAAAYAAAGDFNGDGKIDLICTSSSKVAVLLGQ